MLDDRKRGFLTFAQHDRSLANTETFSKEGLDLARLGPGGQCGRWLSEPNLIHNMSYFLGYLAAI
jgi:hypothetical protein